VKQVAGRVRGGRGWGLGLPGRVKVCGRGRWDCMQSLKVMQLVQYIFVVLMAYHV
jgi:hypothetical protein